MTAETLTGFPRPALDALIGTRRQALVAALGDGPDKTVVEALSFAMATAQHDLHSHLDWLIRMLHPLYAEGEWLEAWGQALVGGRSGATCASGPVVATGQDGATILRDTVLRRDPDGMEYLVSETATVTDGRAVVAVRSQTAGAGGNMITGTLMLVSPIAGLDRALTVTGSGISGGVDAETPEAYRARTLERLRNKACGGDDDDWIAWAKALPGVTDAWISPHELGVGSLVLRFLMREARAEFGGVPQGDAAPYYSGDLKMMVDHIAALRPSGMRQVVVMAPQPLPLAITVRGLSPDNDSVRAAIAYELEDMIRRKWSPNARMVDGESPMILFRHAWIADALAAAAGHDHWQSYSPDEDIPLSLNQVPMLEAINYVDA